MQKLNIIETPNTTYDQNYIDWCNREKIDLEPISYSKKVEGGEIVVAEKINEIVDFLNNLK